MQITFDPSRRLRGFVAQELATIRVVETPVGGSVVDTPITAADVSYTERTTTGSTNNCQLVAQLPFGVEQYSFTSHTPSICRVDQAGNVARVANGWGHISLDTSRGRVSFKRNFLTLVDTVRITSPQYVAGSLGKHVRDAIAAMVSGKTPGAATQSVLTSSSGGWEAPNYVRNASLFTGVLDLSAISVYTEANGNNRYPMVLVTQRHVIGGHAGTYPGKRVVFKAVGGTHEVRTVLAQVRVNKTQGEDYVGILSAPIVTITPMKLMPATWQAKWPSYNTDKHSLPVLNKGWTAGDRIRIIENWGFSGAVADFLYLRPASTEFAGWSSNIIGGDSNGPVFVPINGAPVLLHCMNFAGGGAHYSMYLPAIKAAMDSLSTAHGQAIESLGAADLSGFTSW